MLQEPPCPLQSGARVNVTAAPPGVWAGAGLGPPLLGLVVPCCAIHSSPATSHQPHQGTLTSHRLVSKLSFLTSGVLAVKLRSFADFLRFFLYSLAEFKKYTSVPSLPSV